MFERVSVGYVIAQEQKNIWKAKEQERLQNAIKQAREESK